MGGEQAWFCFSGDLIILSRAFFFPKVFCFAVQVIFILALPKDLPVG